MSRDSELELEIDLSKEEIGESLSPSEEFAELSERNVKKFENLFNDFKENERLNNKPTEEEDNDKEVTKELTVEEAMEALHCEEPSPTPESGISDFAFKEPYCVTAKNIIESGNLEKVDEEIERRDMSTLENSDTSNDYTNHQSDEINILNINSNLDNDSGGKERNEELETEDHSSTEKPKSPPDSKFAIRELQKEDCSVCQVCEVSMSIILRGLLIYNLSFPHY